MNTSPWIIVREPLEQVTQLEARWLALEAHAHATFYQRWRWIGNWLAALPDHRALELISVRRQDAPEVDVALGILGRHALRQPGGIRLEALHLHATGDVHWDRVAIEHNGWLTHGQEDEQALTQALVQALLSGPQAPHALVLPGLRRLPPLPAGVVEGERELRPAWLVDLKAITDAGKTYLEALPSRARRLVRKAQEGLSQGEPLRLVQAHSEPQALAFLESLMQLHQLHWAARGEPGAFAHEGLRELHRRLVRTGWADGSVVLLALLQGARPLAYLLYHCHDGWAHYYQSGIDYTDLPAGASPGLAAHALAIEHFRQAGHVVYDFMAGDLQYKRTLATGQLPLVWVQWQRDVARTRLARWVRTQGREVKRWLRRTAATRPPVETA